MAYRFLTGEHLTFDPAVSTLEGMHTPYCWGCGLEAEQGLGLRPELHGSMIRADLEFARRFEGGPGTVHGGAISAFVDDLLGYVPVAYGSPGVTARLDTNYIAPVPMGVTVSGLAWMSRVDERKMWAEGTIEYDGNVLVGPRRCSSPSTSSTTRRSSIPSQTSTRNGSAPTVPATTTPDREAA